MPAKRPGTAGTAPKGTKPKATKAKPKKPAKAKAPPKPMGRPPAFSSPAEFEARIEEYFATIGPEYLKDKEGAVVMTTYGKPCVIAVHHPTVISLAHHLGLNRDTWQEYRKKPEFSVIARRADERIQSYMVSRLMDPDVKPPGIQFILKNLHGWKDEQEVKHSGEIGQHHSGEVALKQIEITLVRPAQEPEPKPDDSTNT